MQDIDLFSPSLGFTPSGLARNSIPDGILDSVMKKCVVTLLCSCIRDISASMHKTLLAISSFSYSLTNNLPGANYNVSLEGVRHMDVPNN